MIRAADAGSLELRTAQVATLEILFNNLSETTSAFQLKPKMAALQPDKDANQIRSSRLILLDSEYFPSRTSAPIRATKSKSIREVTYGNTPKYAVSELK